MAKKRSPYLPLVIIGILFLALYVAVMSTLVLNLTPPLTTQTNDVNREPTVRIILYAGEASDGKLGFGTIADVLTSPGPTLQFTITDVVSVTVVNVGKMPHAFAVTDMPRTGARTLFNAAIGSATNPLAPGEQRTITFAPTHAGSTFYYICPISGHAESGMWGAVVVTG